MRSQPKRPKRARGRKPRDGEGSRRQLLDAAEEEFAARGYAGARLLAIARAAGIKPGLIHFHFGGKDGLYSAVLSRAVEAMEAEVRALLANDAELVAADRGELHLLGEALVALTLRFHTEHGRALALFRQDAARGSPIAREMTSKYLRPAFEIVIERLERLKDRGVIASDVDARHLFASVVSMAAYPIHEPLFTEAVWPDGPRGEAFLAERRRQIVAMAIAHMAGAHY